jgi:DNA-binding beta-propeller fold protein YncE
MISMMRRCGWLVLLSGLLAGAAVAAETVEVGQQPDGRVLVSSNQAITPAGTVAKVDGARPKDLAVSPDGQTVAVLAQDRVIFYSPTGDVIDSVRIKPGPLGLAWTPDGRTLFASGDDGQIYRLEREAGHWKEAGSFKVVEVVDRPLLSPDAAGLTGRAVFDENGNIVPVAPPPTPKGNPQVAGLAVSPNGRRLYAALAIRNAVAVLDLPSTKTIGLVPVGVAPYNIALSPDGGTLFVANRGGEAAPKNDSESAPSAGTLVHTDKATDAGLRGSVSFIDTATLRSSEIPAGRQPSGMAVSKDGGTLCVANSDGDTVSVVDTRARRIVRDISVRPERDAGFGQMPTSLALSEDGGILYVACGGANAVAVVALQDDKVSGYVPTGWFPISIGQRAGRLFVASAKGLGDRLPNKDGNYYVHDTVGTVQFIAPDMLRDLATLTRQVAENNRWADKELPARPDVAARPIPERVGEPSVFKHVVFVIKENHTYDLDLGDMKEGNGDAALCTFGEEITPNLHALARQFVLLDNTYTSGTNSADGHQWTDSALANAYMEQNYSSYARSYPYDGGDPLAYSPQGFLWNAARAQGKSVRVYGEFVNRPTVRDPKTGKEPTWTQLWEDRRDGANRYEILADTDSDSLRPLLHPHYVGWPIIVSDQYRADQYIAELHKFEASGRMPDLSILLLPCNHTSGTSPGFPTPRASVADNDRALGRIVEAVSRSRFWKDTLIMVIEDDSQFGVDHVDGHRTTAYCVSPYTRRGVVVSEMYNHTSVLRTMELALGLPAMNRFDRTATPMTACFTDTPDFRPYAALPNRVALDEINPPRTALSGEARKLAEASARQDWSGVDKADATVVARAMWSVQRPGEPFPWKFFHPNLDSDD